MKNLVLAILIAILLVNCVGHLAHDMFDINVTMHDEIVDPLKTLAVFCVLAVVMVVIGFVVAISLFGALAFVGIAVSVGLLVTGVSLFWPMLLFAAVVIWLVKDKPGAAR